MSNKLKFGLLGALGYIAPRHIQAINNINADLRCVSDLDFNPAQKKEFLSKNIETLDSLEEMNGLDSPYVSKRDANSGNKWRHLLSLATDISYS